MRTLNKRGTDTESIWNIFVQILLPLVLILTFVSALDIMRYKDIAEIEMDARKELEKGLDHLMNTEVGAALAREGEAIQMLQLQVLLRALLEVKDEKEIELKLSLFRTRSVELESGKIKDSDFLVLCQKTKSILSSKMERKKFSEDIFKKVLIKAKEDPSGIKDIKDTNKHTDNVYTQSMTELSPKNKEIIEKEIISFISSIESMTVDVQENTLLSIFEYLKRHPDELSSKEKELVREIIDPETITSRRINLANQFYQSLIEKLKKPITEDGYVFLNETWDKFRSI